MNSTNPGRATPPTAVVLAAGKGTRMISQRPKVLHSVLGEPMAAHVVRAALAAGCGSVVVVVGYGAAEVEAELRARLPEAPLRFVVQREQLGTGHAVLCAAEALADCDGFFVLSGDVPGTRAGTLSALWELADREGADVALVTCHLPDPSGYGRVVRDPEGRVRGIVEHRDASDAERRIAEVNAGLYYFRTAPALAALRGAGADNAQGEIYLTAAVDAAATRERAAAMSVDDGPEVWGVNDRADLAQVETALGHALKRSWMQRGVTIRGPETVHLDAAVTLEADVTLGRGVRLLGSTHVEAGARIDDGAVLTDARVAAGAHVKPYCVIEEAVVGPGAAVGPFAHLRPGSELGAGAKVGNFVETKKARLGDGAKASHLTYLGDCEVGPGANVGAGTITCNYDGESKWPTKIGAGAFIGSGTQLVAPVSVGDGAYVGAGSTITEDVPSDALGLGRGRQRNIEGWATRRRQARRKEG